MSAPSEPLSLRTVGILLYRELQDSWRNRWFLLYAGAFTVLALGLSWISVSGVAQTGYANLGRTAGSLINLVILIVPLMGLTLGSQAIAADRERGALLYLMAQPVDIREIILGKFLGLTCAVLAALLLGFTVAGVAVSGRGGAGDVSAYLAFLGLAALLATASVAMGLLISALSSRSSMATGIAVFCWLGLVFAGDLGLMGTTLVLDLGPKELLAAALVNPLQVFQLGSVMVLRGGLEALGPAGLYATRRFGEGLVPLLVAILSAWCLVPLLASSWWMKRRGALP
jgi:Cu-processing system permease protein